METVCLSALVSLSGAFLLHPFVPQLKHSAPGRFTNYGDTTMRYQSPWDFATTSASRARQTDGDWSFTSGRGSCLEPLPSSLPRIFDNSIRIGDPEVSETQTGYTLTFNLPAEAKEEGLDVSISGRILTMEARVTRDMKTEGDGESLGSGHWNQRSRSTHSCARSFVLPNSVSSNDVKARWAEDGSLKIVLEKGDAGADAGRVVPPLAGAAAVPVEHKNGKTNPSSAVDDYLSRLKATTPRNRSRLDPWAELTGSSLLATIDDDFRNFGKSVFIHDGLRFPTEDQVAAIVARAREERARRVTAIKRATMVTDVLERPLSYVVRFSLPEGATRKNVKLTVTPDKAIRVNFSPDGRRSVSKYVRLPWDASLSEISAKFKEDESRQRGGGKKASRTGGDVSRLTVTVGRKAPPPQPNMIDIE